MNKNPFISYHKINDTFETLDLKLIKILKDPILLLKNDFKSGLIFGSDLSQNMVILRISKTHEIQIMRILDCIQEDFSIDMAILQNTLYTVSYSDRVSSIVFEPEEVVLFK